MLPERRRAALSVVAAVGVVAVLSLVTVSVMSSFRDDGDDRASVDADSSTATTTTEATIRRTAPRPTTTSRPGPEVRGETTERTPGTDAAPGAPSGGQTGPTSTPGPGPAPFVQPAPATPPPPAPTPTSPPTTVCRNSTDPSCGEFSWSPQPGPYDVEVFVVSAPGGASVGDPVTFAVDYIDPAGLAAEGACLNWWTSDPAVVNTSSCNAIATSCDRTGPHEPPPPSRDRIALEHTIVFETPGEHAVRIGGNIATHLLDGCESPYRNTFTRTFTIVVD